MILRQRQESVKGLVVCLAPRHVHTRIWSVRMVCRVPGVANPPYMQFEFCDIMGQGSRVFGVSTLNNLVSMKI